MTRAEKVAKGGVMLLAGQGITIAVQVATGAATARLLPPSSFGQFAIAMSLTGLMAIALTSGLLTFALKPASMTAGHAWTLIAYSVVAAVVGMATTYGAAGTWVRLWHSPGAATMTKWLSLQVGLNVLAVAQSALLRREQRALADATVQAGGVVGGLLIGVATVALTKMSSALVVSPIATSAIILFGAMYARAQSYPRTVPRRFRELATLHGQVAQQSFVFFLMASLPLWTVSLVADNHEVGLFSRSIAIAGLVYAALSTGLTRALQPYYRHLSDVRARGDGIVDAAVMCGAASMMIFGGMAALGQPLIVLWLGAQWDKGAAYLSIAAAGYAVYTVFGIVANAAETLGYLREVRVAQWAMLPGATLLFLAGLSLHSPAAAAFITLVVAISGLLRLLYVLRSHGLARMKWLVRALVVQATFFGVVGLGTWALTRLWESRGMPASWALVLDGAIYGAVTLATVRHRPEWQVARRRKLLTKLGVDREVVL